MRKIIALIGLSTALISTLTPAGTLHIGNADTATGKLDISGAVRTRYLYKDYADSANEGSANGDWKLADIKLVVAYENPDWIASMDTRCYQYERLCDAIFLKDAWLGYKFSDQHRLNVGLQSVDFGYARLWGNSYYETILNTVGIEDIQNTGIKYQYNDDKNHITLGFYPRDGGNYKGPTKDSSRYSGNFVQADDLSTGTDIEEKNMWIGRISRNISINSEQNFKTEIGASYWYSELENQIGPQDGHRKTWNAFAVTDYQNWQWMLSVGEQDIQTNDPNHPFDSTIGAFDYPYQVANKARFAATEISYSIKEPFKNISEIKPYLTYSTYNKQQSGFIDSDRLNAGFYFFYKNLGIQAEYIRSKNDPMTGDSSLSLGQGDHNKASQLFFVSAGYYF